MRIVVTISQGIFSNGPLPLAGEPAPQPQPNRRDELAVEAALRLAERYGGSVSLVSVGELDAATRDAYLGLGAGELVQLRDVGLDMLGPLEVARLLARLIAPLVPDLVLCGERGAGGPASGLVPFALAEELGLPLITGAATLDIAESRVQVERLVERGDRQLLSAPLPALITLAQAFGEPRYPALAKAHRAQRRSLSLADLGLKREELAVGSAPRELGREKARPRPKKIYIPPSTMSAAERMAALMTGGRPTPARGEVAGPSLVEGRAAEVAAKIIAFLKQEKVLE